MTKDEKARMSQAYELLKGILAEKAGTKRVGSQKKVVTVEEALLAVLRKKVAGTGNHLAFQTLNRYESFRPPPVKQRVIFRFDVVDHYATLGTLRLPVEWTTPAMTQEVWDAHVRRLLAEYFKRTGGKSLPQLADPRETFQKWLAIGPKKLPMIPASLNNEPWRAKLGPTPWL